MDLAYVQAWRVAALSGPWPGLASREPFSLHPHGQVGSCTSQMGQVAIVSLHGSSPKVIECFNVESRILCMVHVPAQRSPEPSPAAELGVPTVCLGTEEGRWVTVPGAGPVRGSSSFRLRGEHGERMWRGSPTCW